MSLVSMLPDRARIHDPGESVDPTTRRVVANLSPALTGDPKIPARAVPRSERTTPRDDDNAVIVDHDVLLARRAVDGTEISRSDLPVGRILLLDSGETHRIVGRAKARRRDTPDVVLWSVPTLLVEV